MRFSKVVQAQFTQPDGELFWSVHARQAAAVVKGKGGDIILAKLVQPVPGARSLLFIKDLGIREAACASIETQELLLRAGVQPRQAKGGRVLPCRLIVPETFDPALLQDWQDVIHTAATLALEEEASWT